MSYSDLCSGSGRAAVWTIGHSTHPAEEFVELLHTHEIEALVDVRSFPASRRCPWFDETPMRDWLGTAGIGYTHLRALGGRRGKQRGIDPAVNGGWRNTSFHNYADYTSTAAYAEGLADLQTRARKCRLAFMCAEAVPWRCHRSLIASSLTAADWEVRHILDRSAAELHVLGEWGPEPVVDARRVTYPAQPRQLTLDLGSHRTRGSASGVDRTAAVVSSTTSTR